MCGLALAGVAPDAKAGKGKKTGEPKRNAAVGQFSQPRTVTGRPSTGRQAVHSNGPAHQIGTSTKTDKPSTSQAVYQTRTVHRTGTPAGDGKRTTVRNSTEAGTATNVSTPTTITRTRRLKATTTTRTEVTPAAQPPHNSNLQPLNTTISETAPALQLQRNSNVQSPNTSIGETVPASKLNQNTSVLGVGGSHVPPPPPGGWKPLVNPANRPGSESGITATGGASQLPPTGGRTVIPRNKANGPETEGTRSGSEPPAPGIMPYNPANGPQTLGGGNGSQLPPPPMVTSTSQPINMANRPQNEPPTAAVSTGYSGNTENKSTSEIAPNVQFKQNRRIQGSDRWVDSNYEVFRNYRSEWHDRDWWRSHHSHIAFGVGGWYYLNAKHWFPAWGYDPNAYYAYDGPIYAHKGLPPDQVIADVQETLQKQGYYRGEVDGLLGPPTRTALGDYQRDHSLYVTSAIDSPTLQSLGMR
jgi:Putative peptidoglycan binding domain